MNKGIKTLIDFIDGFKAKNPKADKQKIQDAVQKEFKLKKNRSVYECEEYSIRFSEASGASFSNTVLSLSAVRKTDHKPLLICIVHPKRIEYLLANTSFIKKISHTSMKLTEDKVRGSFLGNDIMREYNGISNSPENFDKLFALHKEIGWDGNIERIVEMTNKIKPTGQRFNPTSKEKDTILKMPEIARKLSTASKYLEIENELRCIVEKRKKEIIEAAQIDNINIRGNKIEQIMTRGTNLHSVDDIKFDVSSDLILSVDIKSKLLAKSSAPEAYNVDKILKLLSSGKMLMSLFFIGIDVSSSQIHTKLLSIFDIEILNATRIQPHWAGRNSRGVSQLSNSLSKNFEPGYKENIDVAVAGKFLKRLLGI